MRQNTSKWLVENQVVLTKLYMWDKDKLTQLMNNVNDFVNSSNLVLVHTIWDLTEIESYSTNLNEIRQAIEVLFTNEKLGWVITIIDNPMVAFIARAGSSMYGARYRRFKTIDEAKQFLKQIDSTLPVLT